MSLSMRELLNRGLREREDRGAAAAIPWFQQAAQAEPCSHLPWFMLGNASGELGDLDAAAACFLRARELKPDECAIRFNLGLHQLWRGYVDAAIEELAAACRLNPAYLPARSTYLLALHSSARIGPEEIGELARRWGRRFASGKPPALPAGGRRADAARRLRVGLLSGDFRTHSVAHFIEPILATHQADRIGYVLYDNSPQRDSVSARLRSYVSRCHDVAALSDAALLQRIRADQIDILVDLSGHTAFNRLAVFASRAAAVQITYLGYPDSTGLPAMDYRICDATTDPPKLAERWHTERLLRLPGAQWCFGAFGTPPAPEPLPAEANRHVTFGSFNSFSKLSDTLLNCWIRILSRLPGSRLRLTRVRSPQRLAEIVALLSRAGIDAARIDAVAEQAAPPHGRQFCGVDIALDHYPYNGVTTTCESLSAGVPVVSLHGHTGASRSGLSLLTAVGLAELVAATPEQYIEIAVALARDWERLRRLRHSLLHRLQASPLRDERRFSDRFAQLLLAAWSERDLGGGAVGARSPL